MRVIRVLFVLMCAALLGWAGWRERHVVHPFSEGQPKVVTGPGFVKDATVDGYLLRDGKLFDLYSLSGTSANEKDCKT